MQHLSDEDIDTIVDKVCDKMESRLYNNLGQGVWGLAWRGILIGLLLLAAWGAGLPKYFQ